MKLSSITLWADNPRKITDEAFEKLKSSLTKDLVYLKENPIKLNKIWKELIVYAWNQRVKALRELWYEEIDDKYFTIVEIDEATMIERGIKDNEWYWEYDRDKLSALSKKMILQYTNWDKQEKAEFHNIVFWAKLAEIAGRYVEKGKQIYIEGRLQTRSWEAKDGSKRYKTEIVGENMILLWGWGKSKNAWKKYAPNPTAKTEEEEEINVE